MKFHKYIKGIHGDDYTQWIRKEISFRAWIKDKLEIHVTKRAERREKEIERILNFEYISEYIVEEFYNSLGCCSNIDTIETARKIRNDIRYFAIGWQRAREKYTGE
ncbi:MAG: hypothetical protein KAU20_07855 [Nanoarchaeota archaeon]|nr:hypothetical protein [Nanoarchaeota archaeon]